MKDMKWLALIFGSLLFLILFTGCAAKKIPAVHIHAVQWGDALTLPLFENETTLTVRPGAAFVGFWVAAYTNMPGEVSCFLQEFYDGRNTFSRTAFLVPLGIGRSFNGDVISTGFATYRAKPKQILYSINCTRGNETFLKNYTIKIKYEN